jgi:hypothetical protein
LAALEQLNWIGSRIAKGVILRVYLPLKVAEKYRARGSDRIFLPGILHFARGRRKPVYH